MPLETQPSRFAVLPDDVSDPLGNKKGSDAPKKKKTGDKNKPKPSNNNASSKGNNSNKKTLKSLAFGGLNDGKKKGGPVTAAPALGSTNAIPGPSTYGTTQPGGQWDEWRQRDNDVVEGAYESALEAAMIQSKLEFQNEQARRDAEHGQPKAKSKKKPVAVPLNEFNAKLAQKPNKSVFPSHTRGSGDTNGGIGHSNLNFENKNNVIDHEEELIERLRLETRLELEREKKLDAERDMLKSRQSQVPYQKQFESRLENTKPLDPRDETISALSVENDELRKEVESYKSRMKKVLNILQQAQELKDKAKLLYEVESLNKLNEDLNEEVRALQVQLEQERSKSHAAMTECRKLIEQSRRRTTTETSQ